MTITTQNEVLVTCENTPLMELLEHLAKDHAPDLDYCLAMLDWYDGREPQEATQKVHTRQEFFDLPLGTVVKIPVAGTYYKIAINTWSTPRNMQNKIRMASDDDMSKLAVSVNAPAVVLFTPEV